MARAATMTTVMLLFLIVLVVGGILLQIFLSKRESKWPGLVLPGITLLYSLVMLLNMAYFVSMARPLLAALGVFLTCNIPTFVLLAIYFACRSGRRKKSEMERMSIDDL